jgi:hypothetical protein
MLRASALCCWYCCCVLHEKISHKQYEELSWSWWRTCIEIFTGLQVSRVPEYEYRFSACIYTHDFLAKSYDHFDWIYGIRLKSIFLNKFTWVYLHENNNTSSRGPKASVKKQLQYFSSVLNFSITLWSTTRHWLKSALLSAEANHISYFYAKFGEHVNFVQCIEYADNGTFLWYVCGMHTEFRWKGGTSGSLFGSQRIIRANEKIDIDEVEYCFYLLLSIVNNNNI